MELGLFVVGDADKNYASGVVVQYCGICLILYLLNCLVFLLVPFQFDKERGKSDVLIWQINYISDTSSRRRINVSGKLLRFTVIYDVARFTELLPDVLCSNLMRSPAGFEGRGVLIMS